MPKFYLCLILITSLSVSAIAQNPYLKTSIYFETDKYLLTPEHLPILDNLIADLSGKQIIKVVIRGNTDADADSLYNLKLSEKRATSVSDYLSEKGLDKTKFVKDYYGENKPKSTNSNEVGKQQNRRVDIIITYKNPIPEAAQPIVEVAEEIQQTPNENCDKDTIVYLPGGSQIKMNACEYRLKKDCISFKEYITPESIREAGLTTMDDNGNELLSGGMITFETCDTNCLNEPAYVRLPVPCNLSMNMLLYTLNGDSTWSDPQNQIRVVSQGGNLFYEFPIQCAYNKNVNTDNNINNNNRTSKNVDVPVSNGNNKSNNSGRSITFNCDVVTSGVGTGKISRALTPKTKFKAEKGMTLNSVTISSTCPLGQYVAKINRRGTKAKFVNLGCLPQTAEVRIIATKDSAQIVTGYKSLRLLTDVKFRKRCDTNPKLIKVNSLDFIGPKLEENFRM